MKVQLLRVPELSEPIFDELYRGIEIVNGESLRDTIARIKGAIKTARQHRMRSPKTKRGKIVDVACGIGTSTYFLARSYPQAEVMGVDISKESIAYAEKHYASRQSNVHYQVGDVGELSDHVERADLVVCAGALHHFPDLGQAIDQMKAAAPQGTIVIQDGNRERVLSHFSAAQLKEYVDLKRMASQERMERLEREGRLEGEKAHDLLKLMSLMAGYTPAEVRLSFGPGYRQFVETSDIDYCMVAQRMTS